MTLADLLLLALVWGYGAAALVAVAAPGRAGRLLSAAAGSLAAGASLGLAGIVLSTGVRPTLAVPGFALTPLVFAPDLLGAFFLAVVGLVGLAASIYGYGYTTGIHTAASRRVAGACVNLLLLTLSLQVMADNPLTFLVTWEAMSLAAYFLVLAEPEQPGAVGAANWYLGVTHAGFAALLAMFLLFSGGQLVPSFDLLRGAELGGGTRNAIFLLALVGFGTKAGLIPLHVWLPRAHPVAPSHGSALMSGVVLKMGVYGFVRVAFDLLGAWSPRTAMAVPPWWGVLVLGLGTLSAVLGVLYALMQHDLKRLLAYHSIENVGIIFMGVGAALLFLAYGLPLAGALALAAGLYHTLNHACFKGLLFLGGGAVAQATGTRNIEEMGGLIGRMPVTAFAFLVGSAAISALPPLNGFASEWLLFQSLLGGARIPAGAVAILMPVAVGLLALTSGLAAACFVKAFGITFLAIPRSPAAERATEVHRSMLAAMILLVGACLALGVTPFLVVPLLGRVISGFPGLGAAAGLHQWNGFLGGLPDGSGQMAAPWVAAGLLVLALVVAAGLRLFTPRLRIRREATWGCGRWSQTPRMQYTATAFAEPLRRVFAELYRPTEDLSIEVHPDSKYFIRGITYESRVRPLVDRLIYAPLVALVSRLSDAVRSVQAGSVHLYLAYLCAALLVLLLAARWLP
jgi:hydrogenase-4 component B